MIQQLPSGGLDFIGDVHGSMSALMSLISHAGYRDDGTHPEGRFLVLVGDLVNRGEDSPAVLRCVQRWVAAGRAAACLGNHELGLLEGRRRPHSNWFWQEADAGDAQYEPWVRMPAGEREDVLQFLARLPLALERDDVRAAHAAWDRTSVEHLRQLPPGLNPSLYSESVDAESDRAIEALGLGRRSREERKPWKPLMTDPGASMPMLRAVAERQVLRQMRNPVRVLTSGVECQAAEPYFMAGRWRFAQRAAWWNDYADEKPVIVGHYWRKLVPEVRTGPAKGDEALFDGVPPDAWLGREGRVFCVDYSVGARWAERMQPKEAWTTRLGMLRWPERTLLLDDGRETATQGFGGRAEDDLEQERERAR